MIGRADGRGPEITGWFPKSALDDRAIECPEAGDIYHSSGREDWFVEDEPVSRKAGWLIGLTELMRLLDVLD